MASRRAVLGVLLSSAIGCGSTTDHASANGGSGANPDAASCKPGTQEACTGSVTCEGDRTCLSKGTWSPCACGWATWGSGGAGGGAAGSSASGGADGGSGGGAGSCGTVPSSLDLSDATIYDNPPNLADWPITTTITRVDFQYLGEDGVHVEFSKQDGPNRWPDVYPPGWDEPLQYTLGMAELIDCKWYASAPIQFWYGLPASGGNVALDNQIAVNWFYNSRWGEMAGYQPATGEVIGIFVVAGNVRAVLDGSQSPVQERSNVVLVKMPDVNGASYTF